MLLADAPEQVFGIFKLLSYPHRFGNDHGDGIERAFTTDLDPVGRTIVDVGLLDCHAVVDAVRRGFVVHAFEPVPSYMANCRRMLKRNSFVDAPISAGTPLLPARWHNRQREILNRRPSPRDGFAFLYAAALSNVTMGAVPFYEAGGSSSFASRGIRKHNITRIEVPVIRLDDAVDENLWLLKVDTQGHEWHVFSGASRLFARRTVAHVLTEFDPRLLRRQQVEPLAVIRELKAAGFVCLDLRDGSSAYAAPWALGKDHPLGGDAYVRAMEQHERAALAHANATRTAPPSWAKGVGSFDDLACINVAKVWEPGGQM